MWRRVFLFMLLFFTLSVSLTVHAQEAYKYYLFSDKNLVHDNQIQFEIVNSSQIPTQAKEDIKVYKEEKGFKIYQDSDYTYVSIFLGEKPTGGYGIKILNIENKNDQITILVEEISPSPEDFVTQALTYPYLVIRMKSVKPPIIVKNTFDIEYSLLSCNENNTMPKTPLNPSKDVKVRTDKNFNIKTKLLTSTGKFVKVNFSKDKCFVFIKESNNKISIYYINNNSALIKDLKKIKPGTNLIIEYSLKNQIKYKKTTAMQLLSYEIISMDKL